jgi:hypothetical protein
MCSAGRVLPVEVVMDASNWESILLGRGGLGEFQKPMSDPETSFIDNRTFP